MLAVDCGPTWHMEVGSSGRKASFNFALFPVFAAIFAERVWSISFNEGLVWNQFFQMSRDYPWLFLRTCWLPAVEPVEWVSLWILRAKGEQPGKKPRRPRALTVCSGLSHTCVSLHPPENIRKLGLSSSLYVGEFYNSGRWNEPDSRVCNLCRCWSPA